MNLIVRLVTILAGILAWFIAAALGVTLLLLAWLAVDGWYQKLRYRRREQAAAEATQRARRERLDRDRAITAAMESQFANEGEAP